MSKQCINWSELENWQEIGSGSFGKVFKAEYLGTEVAVKEFLTISDIPQLDVKKYTDREIAFLTDCRHPNVVQFMGICINEDKLYVVTEYINGGNLKDLLLDVKRDLSWWTRVQFAQDTARAIIYLHHKDIIHRDLKSENLLLTENKRIKVCDFGLSRALAVTKEEKQRLSFCGTDAYMAPEIMLCIPFDTAADIFSFGMILLELTLRLVADTSTRGGPVSIHPLLNRCTPGLGLDHAKIHEAAPSDCPSDFLELALDCCQDSPLRRPGIKDIMKRLRKIEAGLLVRGEHAGNIGILTAMEESDLKLYQSMQTGMDRSATLDHSGKLISFEKMGANSPRAESSLANMVLQSNASAHSLSFILPKAISNLDGGTTEDVSTTPISLMIDQRRDVGVPHRFSLVYHLTKSRCGVCAQGFSITRKHLVCDDCATQVHRKCGTYASTSCNKDLKSSISSMALQDILSPCKRDSFKFSS